MLKLIKYLKPYVFYVIAAIALLFVVANAQLALPDYLSRIVNVGIQQNGIDSVIPEYISKSQLDKVAIFFTDQEKTLVYDDYQLVDKTSADYAQLVQTVPALETEPVYVLKDLTKDQMDQLKPVISRGLVTVYGIQQVINNPAQAQQMLGNMPFDPSKIPAGTDIFAVLKNSPTMLDTVKQKIDAQFQSMPDTLVTQMTTAAIREEYQSLNINLGKIQTNYILRTGGVMVLLALVAGVTNIAVSFLAARTSAGVARDVRRDVFTKVESFSSQEFNKFSTASLITRATNDITQIQQVVFMVMRLLFFAPIMGVGGVIRAVNKSPNMWWIIALAVGVLILLIVVVFFIAVPKFKIIQKLIDRLNLVTRENLSGMMVIRAFDKQGFEEKRFDDANKDLAGVTLFINRVMATMMPVMMLIMNGLSILIIWIGAHQIAASTLQVGDMMAFLQYSMQIMFSFLMISMLFIFLPRASVSGDRIAEVLDSENVIRDPQDPKPLPEPFQGKVEFRDVYFRYPDAEEDVLQKISFTAQPGEVTAIIGSTGCGKSTVVNLVPRFYDVYTGQVLVDNVDVRDVNQHDLRAKIGYTPQKGVLFSGTIESNLKLADQNASEATLRESVEIAQAADFVFDNPEGLEAPISQGGSNVSGGQKQRLSIARSLVKKPPIFIFDDTFSALDFKTDATLRKALKEKTGDSTVLLVTQRVATVMSADQIIVLDNGKIVGKGTHKDLMKTCQTYQEIATSQLSKEELA